MSSVHPDGPLSPTMVWLNARLWNPVAVSGRETVPFRCIVKRKQNTFIHYLN